MKKLLYKMFHPKYHDELLKVMIESAMLGGLGANLLLPLFFIHELYDFIAIDILFYWFLIHVILFIFRIIISKKMSKAISNQSPDKSQLLKLFLLVISISGLVWGGMSFYVILNTPDQIIALTITLVVGLTAASITTLGTVFHAFLLFVISALILMSLALFLTGDFSFILVGLVNIFYLYIISSGSYKHYKQMKQAINLNKNLSLAKLDADKARKEADKANQEKTQFLANMSHEIRTPMNAIIGFTELGIQDSDKNIEYLKIVQSSSQHLLELINNILDISKVEAGEFKLESTVFSLSLILKEINETAKILAENKDIEINIPYQFDSDLLIKGDPLRTKQILTNLIANAIKFTDKGEVSLNVELIGQFKKNNKIESKIKLLFVIKDTGIGISSEQQKHLFNNFFQADSGTSRKYGGTGLGLAISKQLISKMGGKINVRSEPGKGSTFKFMLSFDVSTDLEKEAYDKLSQSENTHFQLPDVDVKTILLVEDNAVNLVLAQTLLESSGYIVDSALNGQEAIEMTEKKKYDCILMDINMPVMDGFEATKNIRQQEKNKDLPIIAMTASALSGAKEQCLISGMNDYISKPIDIKKLNKLLSKWMKPKIVPFSLNDKQIINEQASLDLNNLLTLNINVAVKRFDNEQLYFKSLKLFKVNQRSVINEITRALKSSDSKHVLRLFHHLKGIFEQIGAERVHEIIKRMEINFSHKMNCLNLVELLDVELKEIILKINQLHFQYVDNSGSIERLYQKQQKDTEKLPVDIYSNLEMLQNLISDYDTDATTRLKRILKDVSSGPLHDRLLKINYYLNKFDYKSANDLMSDCFLQQ